MFASFWAAFDGRSLLTSLEKERRDGLLAFLGALLECIIFYARKLWRGPVSSAELPDSSLSTTVDLHETTPALDSGNPALSLVREHWSRIWDVWTKAQLKLPGESFGAALGKFLLKLCTIDEGERLSLSGSMSVLMVLDLNRALHCSLGASVFYRTPVPWSHTGHRCGGCLHFDRRRVLPKP